MPDSRAIEVADAITALLNGAAAQATFAQQFTAKRDYIPLYDLEQEDFGLTVTVIPADLDDAPLSRREVRGLVGVEVGVQNYVSPDNRAPECDALMLLVQQIKQIVEAPLAVVLGSAPSDCGWQGTQNDPFFYRDLLQVYSVFTSVPKFTFLTRRLR